MEKIKRLMTLLIGGRDLPDSSLDHSLKDDWKGVVICKPD